MSYAAAIAPWHDFFIAVAAAAATLVGLLFVGLSLHLQVVASRPEVRALARVTLATFAVLLISCICLLTPETTPAIHGDELVAFAAVDLVLWARSLLTSLRDVGEQGRSFSVIGVRRGVYRYGATLATYGMLAAAGALLLSGNVLDGLHWMVPACAVGLSVSLRNTWDLLVTLAGVRPVAHAGAATHDSRAATSSS